MKRLLPVFSVVLAAALAVPVLAGPKKPKRPGVSVRVSPRVSHAPLPGHTRHVFLYITIENVTPEWEQYWCPEFRVEWGDGSASGRESDCVPFHEASAEDLAYREYPFTYDYKWGIGHSRINVELHRAGKKFDSKSADITVGVGH
ncbi:MAG TPA: hypothetical protein VD862_01110 [Candidatus Paceibacterota bacterium]|nr:hypothetical protein [Candidatus Paceibacterota bacterium]